MKVLFAVNSESVSDAIIKKYQKDYREILSYKNVYYFNAIQKEIQKDKSYDRIVISADLEPFSTNNYEAIDKFIFEKLDSISDEAHDSAGNEISIILICSDRHAKGGSFLVKLFGLGIYNALLGNDRSMEEVCRLINKPRTKKEAKMYYKIDTDDVNYRTENENEVDELQIQNILFHFRKLGKNTEKYASSFENIAAQYTDEQLKIIINCLPANVKRVLEETSSKYQEIMAANGVMVRGIKSNDIADKEDKKRTGLKIDIIENKLNQTKMSGPIVIPDSVKLTNATKSKRVITAPQNTENKGVQGKRKTEPTQNDEADEKLIRLPNGKIVRKKVESRLMDDEKNIMKNEEFQTQPKIVKPVRKTTNISENNASLMNKNIQPIDELDDIDFSDLDFSAKTPTPTANEVEIGNVEPPKKRRGRPRKYPVQKAKPKGKRGRPRKNPIEEKKQVELPELELLEDDQLNLDSFEEELVPQFNEKIENNNLEDFITDEIIESQEPIQETIENKSETIDLPDLDELDDLDDLDDINEDAFETITEESFDEFDDYDEFGQYETKTQLGAEDIDVDSLYEEDILSDANNNLDKIDTMNELPGLDEEDFEELEEIGQDDFEMILDDQEDDNLLLSDLEDTEDILSAVSDSEEDDTLLGLEEDADTVIQEDDSLNNTFVEEGQSENINSQNDVTYHYDPEPIQSIEAPINYSMSNLNSLMTKDKKIVTFLGSTKNGVSFLVNNLAEIFASVGINTAILDMTKNRNSYYIYTQNEEPLRQIAYTAIEKLQNGVANGIKVKQNLTVYTALPNDEKEYPNAEEILSTLVQNHSLVLIDCDFDTNPAYFASCQEIYLVQSMDILTIQPLTAFLRDLKAQGVFEPEKVRVVINKELKVRGLTNKAIIGGMSCYNDPAMSFMTELFNKDVVKYCSIPFEEIVYSKYLEGMLNCKVSISGYSKNFMNKLRILGDMVYPLTSRQTYSPNSKQNFNQSNFSNSMNDTLKKMKKKY